MRLPDFIVVGAAKSGTTTLSKYLRRHPGVFMATPKEPEYFARDEVYAKGPEWYAQLFAGAHYSQICGEASTRYSNYPEFPDTAARMARLIPRAKLIYLIREPVRRAYGYWVQKIVNKHRGWSTEHVAPTFEEAISESRQFVDGSDYMLQIERFLEFFPRENLLVIIFEEFVKDPPCLLANVTEHIGADPFPEGIAQEYVRGNPTTDHFEHLTRRLIAQRWKRIPGVKGLCSIVPQAATERLYRSIRNSPYGRSMAASLEPPRMLPDTERSLRSYFEERNNALEDFLGLKIDAWRQAVQETDRPPRQV